MPSEKHINGQTEGARWTGSCSLKKQMTNIDKELTPPRELCHQGRPRAMLLRLEQMPATPSNFERIRERVRQINQRLADAGAPFRLRVV
jgi:hypothetical protein